MSYAPNIVIKKPSAALSSHRLAYAMKKSGKSNTVSRTRYEQMANRLLQITTHSSMTGNKQKEERKQNGMIKKVYEMIKKY